MPQPEQVAQDFLGTAPDGRWLDRDGYLAELQAQPAARTRRTLACTPQPCGAVTLVHRLTEGDDTTRPHARLRHTHVCLHGSEGWQLVAAQATPLQATVAPGLHSGTEPACAPWPGADPVGTELQVLQALNERYVQSFREADVAWYAAHLSADFRVVQGDGAWHDRAQALERFARPTFATTMATFPVDRVRIRRFGDVALIHAENAYTMKDGRRGVSRYTDVWQLQGGRWRCLAAHITPHRAPGAA